MVRKWVIEMKRILVVNPGATSTKIAVFDDDAAVVRKTIEHHGDEFASYTKIYEQKEYRLSLILGVLQEEKIDLGSLDAIVARGGLLRAIAGGTYLVDELMLADLKEALFGEHASNLGAVLANALGQQLGIEAYIVDPVAVDELEAVARVSGYPGIERKSMSHALNMKAMARKAAKNCLRKKYEEVNIITAHLGTGITMAAHRHGRMVDIVDGRVEGPFSADRSGDIPTDQLIKLCYSGKYSYEDLRRQLARGSGLYAYFGTRDIRDIEKDIEAGNEDAELVLQALSYQIAKGIGTLSAVLSGEVDCIVLTGGMAYSKRICHEVINRVRFISRVEIFPGEEEMEALAAGAQRVLYGEEKAKNYAEKARGVKSC